MLPTCPRGVGNSMHRVSTLKEEINNRDKGSFGEKSTTDSSLS